MSYNQPRFCPNTTWNLNGSTLANQSIVGSNPLGIFVSSKNSIYVPNIDTGRIHIWENDSINPTKNISGNLSYPVSIFVTNNGDIYVDNGGNGRVDKWIAETNNWNIVMPVQSQCFGLFVDIDHNLYCSMYYQHQVVKKWLNDTTTTADIAAGAGVQGNASNMLDRPWGISVDINLDLYVADHYNHRIQLFRSGQLNGTTVAGQGSSSPTINLRYPTGIVLDGDQHLFIVDNSNHRIIGSDENGFRCIIACSGSLGSSSDKLYNPISMSFDSYGNIYVTDQNNHRIQKFVNNTFLNESTIISITPQLSTEEIQSTTMTTSPIVTTTMEMVTTTTFRTTQKTTLMDIATTTALSITQKETTMTIPPIVTTQTEMATTTAVLISTDEKSTLTTTLIEMTTTVLISTQEETTLTTSAIVTAQVEIVTTTALISTQKKPTVAASPIVPTQIEIATITATLIDTQGETTLKTSSIVITEIEIATAITATLLSTQNCIPPQITLIPNTNSPQTPLQYRRSQDFYILSTIQLNCNKSLSTIKKWTIRNYTTNNYSESSFKKKLTMTNNDLYIPSNTLPYGIYQFEFKVSMSDNPILTSSSSIYVEISPSGITANLVPLGTSVITSGHQQSLTLNPGNYSTVPDGYPFNASDWSYEYFCRIYEANQPFSSINSCLNNQSNIFQYNDAANSSLTIFPGALQLDNKYQFLVQMSNPRNPSLILTTYAIVEIQDGNPPMIAIECVVESLCASSKLNPTTQVALYSYCVNHCSNPENIIWNIYFGKINSTIWILVDQMDWFYGRNTSKFTTTKDLFHHYSNETLWKFEVIYSFETIYSSSALIFEINSPPSNGSCEINPKNGTTNTLFNITCFDWQTKENIKDYSLYIWKENRIIAFSPVPSFQVRLPVGETIKLIIHIRDTLDGITQYNLSSVTVISNSSFGQLSIDNNKDLLVRLFSSGNQNTICQLINQFTEEYNRIPLTTNLSVSPLGSQVNYLPMNETARSQFIEEINFLANLREDLIRFIDKLTITSPNSLKLQSLSLVQFTNPTNQLTRTTLLFTFNKCFQMTHQLVSWLNKLPFEDVQIIVTQLLQCASNILTGVNGPLQKRMEVLDKDSRSATGFPEDYDTDIELEWTNPNLFADGDDFSWNTLQKGKIFYFQKKLADQFNEKIMEMISLLTSSLKLHLNIGQQSTINISEVSMSLEILYAKDLLNKTIKLPENGLIFFPNNFTTNLNLNQISSLRTIMTPLAIYGQSRLTTINTNLSRSFSLSILDENGTDIPLQINPSTPIEYLIPRDPNLEIPLMMFENITSISPNQSFRFYYLNITNNLPLSIHFEIKPSNINLSYFFIYKFDQLPIYNSSMQHIDGWTLFNRSSNFTYMIDNQQTQGHRFLIFGLRGTKYHLRVYASGCYYLNEVNQWKSDGLLVGQLTNLHQTHCYSTHARTLAGGLQFLPPSIDFDFIFAHADFHRNKTIYSTVIALIVIYILLMIYSRRKDRQDLKKLGITPLTDNRREDQYFYQILVFTGQRQDSGTDSKVHFILNGDQGHTFVRTFSDPNRKIFQRGQINSFLMSVSKSLGLLNYLHIWHDNTGKGSKASWFLKYVIVRDLQTMETCYFIVQKWFAVEKDDGRIERVFPVASESEKEQFSYLLSKTTYHKLSDEHLWLSIFFRSLSNQFTRLQRCTCCFVLLFLSMLFNIIYYDLNQQKINQIPFGPFTIPLQQIIIGMITEFFSLLIGLLLVQFFRRIQIRQNRISPTEIKSIKTLSFPWWCIFIAYGISFLIILISMFFIIAYAIRFGDEKSQDWLISIITGFFSSIFLTQPMKIFGLTIICTLFFRHRSNTDDQEAKGYLDENPIELKSNNSNNKINSPSLKQRQLYDDRFTKERLAATRLERMQEVHMWSIVRETITYIIFFIVLCLLVYPNRNQHSFHQVQHLRNFFSFDQLLSRISTIDQYWHWLENELTNNLRAQKWYNGYAPRNLSGYIDDKTNRLIGWATMRQLRVKTDLCLDQRVMTECHYDYSFSNEEKRSFYPKWRAEKEEEEEEDYSSTILKAFQYQSSSIAGYIYDFRGSLSDLRTHLTQLHQLNWIDDKTRAIFIQFNLYNPNLQLFTSLTFLTEFLSTGHIQSEMKIQPMDFLSFTSLFQFICLILYLLIILYFMWIQIRYLFDLKWKYFSRFWSYVQLGIIICSWTAVGVYIWRYKESQRISQLFKQTHGYFYINLQVAAYVNDLLTFLFGFCCFFGTIQFYHLCRFNQRLTLFDKTLQHSANDLGHFCFMFIFIFLAFICLFYFLFSSQIRSYSTFTRTAQMLFEMSLSKFDVKELLNADSFLGPFCFSLFMILIVFICLGMFVSIINDSFRAVRKKKDIQPEVYSYMFNKFLRWTRIKKATPDEIHEEIDKVMRSEYVDKIDHLMNKAQQLSNTTDRITSNQNDE